MAGGGAEAGPHRRKISFGAFRGNNNSSSAAAAAEDSARPQLRSKASYAISEDDGDLMTDEDAPPFPPNHAASTSKNFSRPSGSRAVAAAGETSTHVQSDMGTNAPTMLRFEIFVVKVPLLSLHGIQFKKVEGGTWQYKGLAQRVLGGLRL